MDKIKTDFFSDISNNHHQNLTTLKNMISEKENQAKTIDLKAVFASLIPLITVSSVVFAMYETTRPPFLDEFAHRQNQALQIGKTWASQYLNLDIDNLNFQVVTGHSTSQWGVDFSAMAVSEFDNPSWWDVRIYDNNILIARALVNYHTGNIFKNLSIPEITESYHEIDDVTIWVRHYFIPYIDRHHDESTHISMTQAVELATYSIHENFPVNLNGSLVIPSFSYNAFAGASWIISAQLNPERTSSFDDQDPIPDFFVHIDATTSEILSTEARYWYDPYN